MSSESGLLEREAELWNEFRRACKETKYHGIPTISETLTGFRLWLGQQLVSLRQDRRLQVASQVMYRYMDFEEEEDRGDWTMAKEAAFSVRAADALLAELDRKKSV